MPSRRSTCAIVALLATLLFVETAKAQDKPSFSGHWRLGDSSSAADNIAVELIVLHSISRFGFGILYVERRFKGSRNADVIRIGLPTWTTTSRMQFLEAAAWQSTTLSIEKRSFVGPTVDAGPFFHHTETWALESIDKLMFTATDRVGASEPVTIVAFYRRLSQ